MRISDWSSDVCSSDLPAAVDALDPQGHDGRIPAQGDRHDARGRDAGTAGGRSRCGLRTAGGGGGHRPRGRGGLPRPHRDVGIAAPLRRGYVPDGGEGSRPAPPYGRPATSTAAIAASAGTACTKKVRRPTVAVPYSPATTTEPSKHNETQG